MEVVLSSWAATCRYQGSVGLARRRNLQSVPQCCNNMWIHSRAGVFNEAAWRPSGSDSPALLKKFSIRAYRWHQQVQCWVNGRMYVVLSSHRTPKMRGKHGAFSILHSALGLKERDQSSHHEVWMHLAHAGRSCGAVSTRLARSFV